MQNKYYHGSEISDLKIIKPSLSYHEQAFVYVSTNKVVASFYLAHCNFYTYGFDKNGIPEYTEYFENALEKIYGNKIGYLYECRNIGFADNPTNINCAFVCKKEVPVTGVEKINNVFLKMIEYEKSGELKIKRFSELNAEAKKKIKQIIKDEIVKEKLTEKNNEYSEFIKKWFPEEWKEALNQNI